MSSLVRATHKATRAEIARLQRDGSTLALVLADGLQQGIDARRRNAAHRRRALTRFTDSDLRRELSARADARWLKT